MKQTKEKKSIVLKPKSTKAQAEVVAPTSEGKTVKIESKTKNQEVKSGAKVSVVALSPTVRQSARKVRLVVDAIREIHSPFEAVTTLSFMPQRAAVSVKKTIQQAIGNALNNFHLPETALIIDSLEVNGGATMKRFRVGGRGRVKPILKRTSRIFVKLTTKDSLANSKGAN